MAKIIFKDNTERIVTAKQLEFILGIKGIKKKSLLMNLSKLLRIKN